MENVEYIKDTFEEYLSKKDHISASDIKSFLTSPKKYHYEKYLKTFNVKNTLRSSIQYILHWGDFMSTIIERQEELKLQDKSQKTDKFSLNVGQF